MAKKGKTDKALAADRSPKVMTEGLANVTERDIARRAYELYLARDREHGHDVGRLATGGTRTGRDAASQHVNKDRFMKMSGGR